MIKEVNKEELIPRTQFFKTRSEKNLKNNSFMDRSSLDYESMINNENITNKFKY